MQIFYLAASLAWIPSTLAQDIVEPTSPKRGLAYVGDGDKQDDRFWAGEESKLTWYYNWQAKPSQDLDKDKLEFVPMLWGKDSAGDLPTSFYDTVKGLIDEGREINYILGFNEPDGCKNGGSCIDADAAAEAWIEEIEPLKDLDLKLGAPAVTGSPRGLAWLQDFYTACDGGCSTDFLPIHWYGNFEGMASYMGQVNETYPNMTMWVTEFGLPNEDLEATQTFFNQSITYLDRTDYVTHYSWFGSFRSDVSNVGPNNALLDSDGELTDMGAYYLGDPATGNLPSGASSHAIFAGWSVFIVAALFWNFA